MTIVRTGEGSIYQPRAFIHIALSRMRALEPLVSLLGGRLQPKDRTANWITQKRDVIRRLCEVLREDTRCLAAEQINRLEVMETFLRQTYVRGEPKASREQKVWARQIAFEDMQSFRQSTENWRRGEV